MNQFTACYYGSYSSNCYMTSEYTAVYSSTAASAKPYSLALMMLLLTSGPVFFLCF